MRISDWSSDVCSSDLTWNGSFTAAYFDESGLYAFGRQAETLQWNLLQLANCLTHIAPVEMLQPVFDSYAEHYRRAFCAAMLWRLGVRSEEHKSELQSLMRISYAVFCLKKKNKQN